MVTDHTCRFSGKYVFTSASLVTKWQVFIVVLDNHTDFRTVILNSARFYLLRFAGSATDIFGGALWDRDGFLMPYSTWEILLQRAVPDGRKVKFRDMHVEQRLIVNGERFCAFGMHTMLRKSGSYCRRVSCNLRQLLIGAHRLMWPDVKLHTQVSMRSIFWRIGYLIPVIVAR